MFEKPGQARHYPAAHSQRRKKIPVASAVCSLRPCWDALSTLESPPIGRRGNGSRSGAVNPEVLRGRGPGDSFEWNRADSSPVRGARVGSSLRPCRHRRRRVTAAGRQGSRPRPPVPTTRRKERKKYLRRIILASIINKLKLNTTGVVVTDQKYGQTS